MSTNKLLRPKAFKLDAGNQSKILELIQRSEEHTSELQSRI